MSYDFRLCRPEAGRSAMEIAESDSESEERVNPAQVEHKRRVANALVAAWPELRPDRAGKSAEASADLESGSFGEEDGGIELNDPDPRSGVQIHLFNREAGVTVAYWHHGDEARRRLERVWSFLQTMEREGGYFTYDGQAGRILDLRSDFELVLATYGRCRGVIAAAGVGRPSAPGRSFEWLPDILHRRSYGWRCGALLMATLTVSYIILRLTVGTQLEAGVMAPMVGGLAVKIFLLDPARLRSIGWSPRLTFLSLFPPAGLGLQLFLLLLSPRET